MLAEGRAWELQLVGTAGIMDWEEGKRGRGWRKDPPTPTEAALSWWRIPRKEAM